MIVLLSGRSLFCHGLSVQLGLMNRPVASVPLSSSISLIAKTLHRLQPDVLIIDALELRSAGFLFLDALQEDAMIAACPILVVASGSFPDEERFCQAAKKRGLHILLEAASFEDLVARVTEIVDREILGVQAAVS